MLDTTLDMPDSITRQFPSEWKKRPRVYTLCLTLRCNLTCSYCYVKQTPATMSLDVARQALDFIFSHAASAEVVEIGFFGGEPLLQFSLLQKVTELIENHPSYNPDRIRLTITTNGTIFSDKIAAFLKTHDFKVCISCDGIPHIQNLYRRTIGGKETASIVERNLIASLSALPNSVVVNAVYTPETLNYLPETLDYFSSLGLRRIYLNPDFSAEWSFEVIQSLPTVYRFLADRYIKWYLADDPHYISLIDSKIAVLLRGGYHPLERCLMGIGELTITPDGGLYPCERLIGSGSNGKYQIGSIQTGLDLSRLTCRQAEGAPMNPQCVECSLRDCCVNWCGCSNIFMTGFSNRVGPFLCASERAAVKVAMDAYAAIENRLGSTFLHHLTGTPRLKNQLH